MTDSSSLNNPSIMSHVSLGTNDFQKALKFYDAVLSTIGATRIIEEEYAVAYGKIYPEFWVNTPLDDKPANTGNGTHFGFFASSQQEVHAFWKAALQHGAKGDGEPGPRPHYGKQYYGCFLRDLDGHKIEATFWDAALDASIDEQS